MQGRLFIPIDDVADLPLVRAREARLQQVLAQPLRCWAFSEASRKRRSNQLSISGLLRVISSAKASSLASL